MAAIHHLSTVWPYYLGICTASLILLAVYLFLKTYRAQSKFAKLHNCQPPQSRYPHRLPFLRLELFFEIAHEIFIRQFTEGVRRRFVKYGSTFYAHMAYRRIVCTIDPVNLESLLRTNFEDYTIIKDRIKMIRMTFGDGVFSTTGDEWKHSRSIIRRAMLAADLNIEMLDKYASAVIDRIKTTATGDKRFNMGAKAFDYSMLVSRHVIFGEDHSGDAEEFDANFVALGSMAKALTLWADPIPYAGQVLYGSAFNRTKSAVYAYVDRMITREKVEGEPLVKGMCKSESDIKRLRGEATNLLFGGQDTVGSAIRELFWFLARSPRVWDKLRAEAIEVQPRTMSDLKRMPYLASVINESLRLRPAVAVHAKKAIRDTVLPRGGGKDGMEPLLVSKGTFVLYSNYALHRNPAVFGDDADEYRPERWADIAPHQYEFLRFGSGPRHCPGKEMAWPTIALFTARMAQNFTAIRSADDREWEEEWSFSFANRHGLHVQLTPAD